MPPPPPEPSTAIPGIAVVAKCRRQNFGGCCVAGCAVGRCWAGSEHGWQRSGRRWLHAVWALHACRRRLVRERATCAGPRRQSAPEALYGSARLLHARVRHGRLGLAGEPLQGEAFDAEHSLRGPGFARHGRDLRPGSGLPRRGGRKCSSHLHRGGSAPHGCRNRVGRLAGSGWGLGAGLEPNRPSLHGRAGQKTGDRQILLPAGGQWPGGNLGERHAAIRRPWRRTLRQAA
mmetsp:Transcript_95935/g.311104  ORF Transcript_95935/g.311104 Transcript_95935/m.311104 type:complete len:232 (+) Transcript_95935:204-899(+)